MKIKPPTIEEALSWAKTTSFRTADGQFDQTALNTLMLLSYIKKLERTANPKDIVDWSETRDDG